MLTLHLRFFNLATATFAGLRALPKVYSNEKFQEIIKIVIKALLTATKNLCKHFFQAGFFNVYKGNNHMACYIFYQECKDYFATAEAKKPKYILFTVYFL